MASSFPLTLTWLLPLLSAGVLMAFPAGTAAGTTAAGNAGVKRFALFANAANLVLIAWLSVLFFRNPPQAVPGSTESALAFAGDFAWFPAWHIRYHVGVDAISLSMMFLAAVVVFCGTLASWNVDERTKEFFVLLQVLAAGVFGSFISFDLFAFFVFNELTLIPTYLLIGMFGSGRKEFAAMKLNLMLMGGSALILLGILGLYFESGIRSFDILELSRIHFDKGFQMWAFPALFLGFAVLGNMFPFHIWSPDGHASAPTAVSMFLAGVHMKLGSYGCLRIAMYLLPEGCRPWMDVFLVLATAGVLWGAFVAVKQKDLKYLNAYSSVSHCGLVFLGLAVLTSVGLRGAVMQMLAHGFITAAVFCLIGMIYARTHTRRIPEMSGLMARMPFLAVSFVIAGFAALGLPGLAGFAAEVNVFLGGFAAGHPLAAVCSALAVLSIVVTAVYVLRAANGILHGPADAATAGLSDATWREKIPLVLLLACILAMGIRPGRLAELLDQALLPILNNLNR
ncbi:MAG TPA: NADH-quinone oxidoreductase subunit M [Fibrobacteria bacterium]|nr:NADH-quinone oxidoreductase subunit M [Fibrobacteria bacterium]